MNNRIVRKRAGMGKRSFVAIIFSLVILVLIAFGFADGRLFSAVGNQTKDFSERIFGISFLGLDSKSKQLQNKMAEISILRNEISNRQKDFEALSVSCADSIKRLKDEISAEQKKFNFSSFQEIEQSPRIIYNLQLIQRLVVYDTKAREVINNSENGQAELTFLYDQADDDLKIVEILDGAEVRKLVIKISTVITGYSPETTKFAIKVDEKELPKLEDVWVEIMKEKK